MQDWTYILRFADEFELSTLRDLAVRRLTPITSAIEKLAQGRLYGVEEWIVPSFVELCLRDKFLTLEESLKIEVRAVHLIASVREDARGSKTDPGRLEEKVRELVVEGLSASIGDVAAKKAARSPRPDKPTQISSEHIISQPVSPSNSLPPDAAPLPPGPNLNPLASPFVPPTMSSPPAKPTSKKLSRSTSIATHPNSSVKLPSPLFPAQSLTISHKDHAESALNATTRGPLPGSNFWVALEGRNREE